MGRRYSTSPSAIGYRRRDRDHHYRDLPTSLLVRNLRYDCRTEDLRGPFGEFGPIKDVYLPRDYYTGELRGFGFVEYVDPEDAAEAKYEMDGQILLGRELTVVFAEENRKKPSQMRARERRSRETSSPIGDYRSGRSYSRSPDYCSPSPRRRHYSRSISPGNRRYKRGRSPRSGSWSRSSSPY